MALVPVHLGECTGGDRDSDGDNAAEMMTIDSDTEIIPTDKKLKNCEPCRMHRVPK